MALVPEFSALPTRPGARQTLLPGPATPRHVGPAHWQFPPYRYWRDLGREGVDRLGRISLGVTPTQPSTPESATPAPAAGTAPRAPSPGPYRTEQRAFTIWADAVTPGAGYNHNSYGPIPWPFRIAGCVATANQASIDQVHWGLFTNPAHLDGNFPSPQGAPLIDIVAGPSTDRTSSDGMPYLSFSQTGTTRTFNTLPAATSYLGHTVHLPNQHVTLAWASDAGEAQRVGVTLTVERLQELRLDLRELAGAGLTGGRTRSASRGGSMTPEEASAEQAARARRPALTCYTEVVPGPQRELDDYRGHVTARYYWREVRDGQPGRLHGPWVEVGEAEAAAAEAVARGEACPGIQKPSPPPKLPTTPQYGSIYGVYGEEAGAFHF